MNEEKGVWIVYDLKANRIIQELLMKNKFAFRFDGSKEIIKKEGYSLAQKEELEFLKDNLDVYNLREAVKERIAQLEKEKRK